MNSQGIKRLFFTKKWVIFVGVRGVAQPGRVLAWGARGRRFDSCHPDQKFNRPYDNPVTPTKNLTARMGGVILSTVKLLRQLKSPAPAKYSARL